MVDPWMLWGTDVWVDVIKAIKVLAHECTVGTDEVWMDVIMVLAHGCSGERMRSGCTLSWFWCTDALGNG